MVKRRNPLEVISDLMHIRFRYGAIEVGRDSYRNKQTGQWGIGKVNDVALMFYRPHHPITIGEFSERALQGEKGVITIQR